MVSSIALSFCPKSAGGKAVDAQQDLMCRGTGGSTLQHVDVLCSGFPRTQPLCCKLSTRKTGFPDGTQVEMLAVNRRGLFLTAGLRGGAHTLVCAVAPRHPGPGIQPLGLGAVFHGVALMAPVLLTAPGDTAVGVRRPGPLILPLVGQAKPGTLGAQREPRYWRKGSTDGCSGEMKNSVSVQNFFSLGFRQ